MQRNGEWTSKGKHKGYIPEYGRRGRLPVIKGQHMLVCVEWTSWTSSRVAPQMIFVCPGIFINAGGRFFYFIRKVLGMFPIEQKTLQNIR